jgi:hypothetical protein
MPWDADGLDRKQRRAEPKPSIDDGSSDEERRLAARRFYRAAPPYCIQFENDGR